jgi:choline dehydrogenase
MVSVGRSPDYIVVGAGTAGCVVASRLSEDPNTRVLLLEAGSSQRLPAMAVPGQWLTLLDTSAVWGDAGAVNQFTGARVATPRGRALGGSSCINGLNFIRGPRSSYDRWPSQGAPGWGFDDLLPYFQRCETAKGRDATLRGMSGPLIVAPPREPNPVIAAAVDAATEVGYQRANDPTSGLETGFGWPDANIVNGGRQTAADAYLVPAVDRSNLEIVTGAHVQRLLIHRGRCVGVEYLSAGEILTANCAAEVVLTAGAIGSPHLLMLSGVGPLDHLRDAGVAPRHELAGVGANLQDHPFATVTYRSKRPIPVNPENPPGEATGYASTGHDPNSPELQFVLISLPIKIPGLDSPEHGYSIAFSVMAPHSRGSVRLASADPGALPIVDPNYLGDERDVVVMKQGFRIARRIGCADALSGWRDYQAHPGATSAEGHREGIEDYLRQSLKCYFHYAGTCRIGDDDMAVVDPRLRVHGIASLRVADASVMPSIVSANTNAAVYAIAEYAAELIKTDQVALSTTRES